MKSACPRGAIPAISERLISRMDLTLVRISTPPVEISITSSSGRTSDAATTVLSGTGVDWTVVQLVGDPALALRHLADRAEARLIVVGTRRRGFGESVREFLTGSVAARLAHRQSRPILVVPLEEPARDEEDLWPEG